MINDVKFVLQISQISKTPKIVEEETNPGHQMLFFFKIVYQDSNKSFVYAADDLCYKYSSRGLKSELQ